MVAGTEPALGGVVHFWHKGITVPNAAAREKAKLGLPPARLHELYCLFFVAGDRDRNPVQHGKPRGQ